MIGKLFIVALALASVSMITAEKELRPIARGPGFCQGCRSIVSFASFYNSTENRTQFKDLTMEFCQLQTSGIHEEAYCNWFTEIVFSILDRIDPIRHCDQLGACSPAGSRPTSLCTSESCQRNSNEIPTAGLSEGIVCEICEQAIAQVKTALTNPEVVKTLKSQAEAFCNYLVIIDQDKVCRHMIDSYLDQAIDFLRNVQPSVYCKSISVCGTNNLDSKQLSIPESVLASFKGFGIENKVFINNKLAKDISSVQAEPPANQQVMKGPNCVICKTMVREMFKFLKNNRTEENIRLNLDKVCSLVFSRSPSKLKNCEEMVQTYSKQIIDMLIDETDPDLICTLLDQCTYITNSPRTVVSEEPINMSEFISILDPTIEVSSKRSCLECKLFIEYIQGAVADAKTEAEVRDWLTENLCNTFGSKQIKDSCINLINTYSGIFFKAVIKELDPKTACVELKACTQSRFQIITIDNKPKVYTSKLSQTPKPVRPNPMAFGKTQGSICDQCVDFVNQIDEYLSSHPLDHDVSVLIDQVCNKIPNETAKNECIFFIKTFGQDIAQAISTMDNPRQLCSKLMLCQAN